ncbi:MAG: metallophosphoesterase family protein [Candidatus Dormibacteria bacterium]
MDLLRRKPNAGRGPIRNKVTRLYIVSDFHAALPAWKKMLNAISLNIYRADVVLYAGDLTGKAIVPITQTPSGFEATLLGARRQARDEQELMALERDITSIGYYPYRATTKELDEIGGDPDKLHALFADKIHTQVKEWMEMAAERLGPSGIPVVLIPGNDDPWEIDPALAASTYCINTDGRITDLPGNLQVLGLGKSSPTPWNTPREVSEDDFRQEIYSLADQLRDRRRSLFLVHCPPYDTGLDTAPLLDAGLNVTTSAGDVLRGPVGSRGVLEAVKSIQPLISIHGHIHESGGERKVGESLCVNPGSEAAFGVVRGYIIDVTSNGIERVFRVEG